MSSYDDRRALATDESRGDENPRVCPVEIGAGRAYDFTSVLTCDFESTFGDLASGCVDDLPAKANRMGAVTGTLELSHQLLRFLCVHRRSPDPIESTSRNRHSTNGTNSGRSPASTFRNSFSVWISIESPFLRAHESYPSQRSLKVAQTGLDIGERRNCVLPD